MQTHAIALNVQNAMPQDTTADRQREYLMDRLNDIRFHKEVALERAYGLTDDEPPRTAEDFLKRIEDGQYILREDNRYRRDFYDRVRWRDPDLKEDQDGFHAATEILRAATTTTRDQILIMDPKDGLLAMQTFEASEFK